MSARALGWMAALAALGVVVVLAQLGRRSAGARPPGTPEPLAVAVEREAVVEPPDPRPRVESSRAEVPVARPSAAAEPEREKRALVQRPNEGLLRIRVLALEDRTPLPGLRMRVHRTDGAGLGARHVEISRGRPNHALITDDSGTAEFLLREGVPHSLWVNLDSKRAGTEHVEVPALTAGEERMLEVLLPTRVDGRSFCRIVDGESGAPISGAVVRLQGDVELEELSGEDGRCELPAAKWRDDVVRVDKEGYAVAHARLANARHVDRPREIPLLRAASIETSLSDAGGEPLPRVLVRARADMNDWNEGDLEWSSRTDERGVSVLDRIMPGRPIALEFVDDADGLSVGSHLGDEALLPLKPGEHRLLAKRIGRGSAVQGIAVDADGRPEANLEVWLVPDDRSRSFHDYVEDDLESERAFRTWTEDSGRFVFEGIRNGCWRAGPGSQDGDASAPAPVVVDVEVVEGEPVPPITIEVHRGLYIRGWIENPDGSRHEPPRPMTSLVTASSGEFYSSSHAKKDGTFALGPLTNGRFRVRTGGFGYADSDPVDAEAGESGVVLRLREGGDLAGIVIDATGRRVEDASVSARSTGEDWGVSTTSRRGGEFSFVELRPGPYRLSAWTESGDMAVMSSVQVAAGERREDIELHLEPAVRLRILLKGGESRRCTVLSGGAEITWFSSEWGLDQRIVVPPGRLELVLQSPGGIVVDSRVLDALAGSEHEVSFAD